MDHFGLTQGQMDRNGVLTQVVKAAVIRDIAEGTVLDRQNITGRIPFNLMKSEKLVWVMTGVDYLEVVTRRERRRSSHGLSIRITRGVNCRPRRIAEKGSAITPGLIAFAQAGSVPQFLGIRIIPATVGMTGPRNSE